MTVQAIEVAATRSPGRLLALSYSIHGEIARLRIPSTGPRGVGERLWQHTCCEAFLAASPGGPYFEFNFSPSGQWAGYAFERYREGTALAVDDPQIQVTSTPENFRLSARIPMLSGSACAALTVVVEEADGRLSYWALRHPPGKPDFHHPAGFALELD
jgi:hypothetical protein